MQNAEREANCRRVGWFTLVLYMQLWASTGAAQSSDLSQFTEPLMAVVRLVVDYIGPAIAIGGLIWAGAQFFSGETGRPFKTALGVVFGGVLIASAEDLWTSFFGGAGLGG